jgi:F-type H+-transporting ATPase subunit a
VSLLWGVICIMQITFLLGAEQITVQANPIFPNSSWFTNSLLVTLIVAVVILVWARVSTRRMEVVPKGQQNLFEATIETLYNTFETVVGRHMVSKVFPLLATLFLFILAANWFGLIPGVGTIGFGKPGPGILSLEELHEPLLRPSNADLNMTLGMAALFMIMWAYWTYREVGVRGFLEHTFAPKGGVSGVLRAVLIPIFIFVGIIEIISIAIRPVSLSLRLFGNIYAGETLLHTMTELGHQLPFGLGWVFSIIFPLPFYFMELLVGLLQAFVFAMLCAVYVKLSTEHEPGEEAKEHS